MNADRRERLARLRRRLLFPLVGRARPIWPVGARPRDRHRRAGPGGISHLHRFLAGPRRRRRAARRRAAEGPSVVGAYRFINRKTADGVTQDVEASLHLRKDVARLGIAPLTSMFWYDQANRAKATDWRPEIHDSRRAADPQRQGRAAVAPARQSAQAPPPTASPTRAPRASACSSAIATTIIIRTTASSTRSARRSGSSPRAIGAPGAVTLVELPTDRRDQRQYRRLLGARRARQGRHAITTSPIGCAGSPTSRCPRGRRASSIIFRGAGGRPGQPVDAGRDQAGDRFRRRRARRARPVERRRPRSHRHARQGRQCRRLSGRRPGQSLAADGRRHARPAATPSTSAACSAGAARR